jgi:hypothetical protein
VEELRLKCQIQNSVPAVIDHANVAFQSALEMFVGVDDSRHALSTFSFLHFLSQFTKEGLIKFTPVFCAGSCAL